jgi:hypothetical protein
MIGLPAVIAIEKDEDHVYVQYDALYMQASQLLFKPGQRIYFDTNCLLSHTLQATASFQRGNTIGSSSGF